MTENEIQQNKENNNVKLTRREAILKLIASENIATQNELPVAWRMRDLP